MDRQIQVQVRAAYAYKFKKTNSFADTYEYVKLNPDIFAPPGTDSGDVDQAQLPLGLSHNRFGTGKQSGWARQQNVNQLPRATEMAGVDMRLAPHAYRKLHWHTANEWSLMLKGSVRLAAVNENGESFVDDISAGIFPENLLKDLKLWHPPISHALRLNY